MNGKDMLADSKPHPESPAGLAERVEAIEDAFSQARTLARKIAELSGDREIAAIEAAKSAAADRVSAAFKAKRIRLYIEAPPDVLALFRAMPKLDAMAANPDEQDAAGKRVAKRP